MLTTSIKRIFGFFEIFARIKKFEFFGQFIKSILQSVSGEEKLTNKLRNLVIFYYGKIAKFALCQENLKRIIKIGQIREKLNKFIYLAIFKPKHFFQLKDILTSW